MIEQDLEQILKQVLKDKTNEFYKNVFYALTVEERNYIKERITNRCCMNCINTMCKVPYVEKIGTDDSGNLNGSLCIGWENQIAVGKSKVLKINDMKKLY